MDDPWNWDVDRVVQELCTSNQSWPLSSKPLKLPPLDQLEGALRENEVDGEVLLTYDQAELCTELGIKILKHKSVFKNAVHDIRLRSRRYRTYLKRQASEFEDDREEVANKTQRSDEAQSNDALEAQVRDSNGSNHASHPKTTVSESAAPLNDLSVTTVDERPSKKRRVIPTLLTAEIDPDRNRNIPTEADTVGFIAELPDDSSGERSISGGSNNLFAGAYLGSKSITRFDIIDFGQVSYPGPPSEESKHVNIISTTRLIPGRMIQTHRLMRRRLLRGATYKRIKFSKSDVVPGSNDPDLDEVLPLYGDSDDDMEFDSATWREIEAEKNEKQRVPKGLTTDEINSTFDRVLSQMSSQWKDEKLSKYSSKANRIWHEARRSGLKDAIDRARRDLHQFEARIAKWKGTIQKNEYRNLKELETALSSFEPSVFDREHRSWLISVLTSPFEPAKINRPREPRDRPVKPQPILEDDEEILTSESEDDLKDFVVDDEQDVSVVSDGVSLPDTNEDHMVHTEYPDMGTAFNENENTAEANGRLSDAEHPVSPGLVSTSSGIKPTGTSKKSLQTPSKQAQPVFIDLTTPPDPTRRVIRYKDGKLSSRETPNRSKQIATASPLIMGITDLTSVERRVANEFLTIDQIFIDAIFSITRHYKPKEVWLDFILPAFDREWPKAPYNTQAKKAGLTAYTLVRLFEIYKDDMPRKLSRYKHLDDEGKQRLRQLYTSYTEEWGSFVRFLKRLSDRFEWNETEIRNQKQDVSATSKPDAEGDKKGTDSLSDLTDASTDTDMSIEGNVPLSREKKKKKKKRKEVVRNREAAIARELDQTTAAEFESRPCRIKEHQVTGVRFMWDQLVAARKRQGCLLAHTMGLGKTMQVITLLATIGQASASSDPTVVSQIPEEMRESRTLIICPSTLVNNWMDEMLSWLPESHGLGDIFKIDPILSVEKRIQTIQTWDVEGGIMIIGYNLFKAFVEDENMRDFFLERPNIVVADEAHMMKNPKAKTHVAAAHFRTLSRVALTGSPLANNVEEYFSMINWVAPNYLGDIREFRAQYANPINQGLHVDSTASDRRRALRMLRVLKSEVSPKVSRITIAVLKHDIPLKKEFVITVPLTAIQRQAYPFYQFTT
ncbi:hypothetical protein ONZ43_g3290 [Nemania bipapillata]|uniref:Uncharacterized protein n=1 Tax=Nemania bipapillata TaxID=110536 RepID=A0ACC2IXB0_9PEZI|nr:hypothetical protein ONZ43_g3290 [Nemania bipapillata]